MRRLLPLLLLAACTASPPQGPVPYRPSAGMMSELREFQRLRPKPLQDLTPREARRQPTMLDAARAIENVRGLPLPDLPVPQYTIVAAPGMTGSLAARLFRPKLARNTPLIVLIAGGGFVTPNMEAADVTARALVERTGYVVLTVAPRAAPEARFPADQADMLSVLAWARRNARSWGADPSRLALGGDSTGAYLALTTALAARDQGLAMPNHLLLITPLAGPPRWSRWAAARPRPLADARWDFHHYAAGTPLGIPGLDPLCRADLRGLPPVTMVLAEGDPLRPDAERLLDRLRAQGVPAQARLFPGAAAGFFPLVQQVAESRGAADFAADDLQRAFGAP